MLLLQKRRAHQPASARSCLFRCVIDAAFGSTEAHAKWWHTVEVVNATEDHSSARLGRCFFAASFVLMGTLESGDASDSTSAHRTALIQEFLPSSFLCRRQSMEARDLSLACGSRSHDKTGAGVVKHVGTSLQLL